MVEEYDIGTTCGVTGSSFELTENGNVVTACSGDDTFREFANSGSTTVWEMALSCSSGPTYKHWGMLYRGVPIYIDN